MENFGVLNPVHSVDKETFEKLKGLIGRKREFDDADESSKRLCGSSGRSQGCMEGSTLEVTAQDILWSQQDIVPELLMSEGTEVWGPTVTLIESEAASDPPLLYSENMHSSSPPPMAF